MIDALTQALHDALHRLRLHLAAPRALLALGVMGVLTGALAALVIIAFRFVVEGTQGLLLPGGGAEDYESLPAVVRLALPIAGALLIGLVFQSAAAGARQVGVVHVMERLAYFQGRLPFKNALLQFVGAGLAIISGHSVGREGPGVHLGAAAGSLLGQGLELPNNSLRTLVACGVAAAIAASFNTPLAGVVFSMEVVMMEYTVAGFAPVILAAVTATTLLHLAFGKEHFLSVPTAELGTTGELALVALLGLLTGVLAATYIQLLQFFSTQASGRPLWWRLTLAGTITGLCALPAPEIMGIGYDTLSATLLGHLGVTTLVTVLVLKMLATTAGIGLGLPGGLIGPTLIIGAMAGALAGAALEWAAPGVVASPAIYAMLGMVAMMGATLQAPLAALTAILELTGNPNLIMAGMLAVIIADLTSFRLFGKDSVFLELLRARGMDYRADPLTQSLCRIGAAAAMNPRLAACPQTLTTAEARAVLERQPQWLLVDSEGEERTALAAADLARWLTQRRHKEHEVVDLLALPARRLRALPIDLRATLQEAHSLLEQSQADALYVRQTTAPLFSRVYGLLTRQDIESAYRQSLG
ncbi:MAG TPA: chloride channel protein [Gammaproteobacteria bacterium]|nr:chloride channel protein [Gammaproteobacteria bacterium]